MHVCVQDVSLCACVCMRAFVHVCVSVRSCEIEVAANTNCHFVVDAHVCLNDNLKDVCRVANMIMSS